MDGGGEGGERVLMQPKSSWPLLNNIGTCEGGEDGETSRRGILSLSLGLFLLANSAVEGGGVDNHPPPLQLLAHSGAGRTETNPTRARAQSVRLYS